MKKETETMDKPKPTISNEVKKMKQGMSYTSKEKTIILNVFKYFRTEYPDKCITELVRRTSKATGCSEKSIFHFRKEESRPEGFKEPSKTKIRKNLNINSRDIKYDDGVRQAIKNIIYDLRYKNVTTSLSMILKQIALDASLPSFSIMTLRRLLMDMGFYYERNGNKSTLLERDESVKKENASSDKKKRNDSKKVTSENNVRIGVNNSNGDANVRNNIVRNSENDIVRNSENEIVRNLDNARINISNRERDLKAGSDLKNNTRVCFNQPVYNGYNGCNQYEFPVHLGHENHRYPMEFYHVQNPHNGGLPNNRLSSSSHVVQPPCIHPQNQSILGLPNT